MFGKSAELKLVVQKKDFMRLYQHLLNKDSDAMDMQIKEQIVYFADNHALDYFKKKKLAIRYRRNNRWLEVVVKKRGVNKHEYEKLEHLYGTIPNHELRVDIDQISHHEKTFSCSLKHTFNSVHQSFAFYRHPHELLTDEQLGFLKRYITKDATWLHFLIPIQSKTFIFPCAYKEFDQIALEEWRMPRLFGNKLYEVTVKTSCYTKKTVSHFTTLCEEFDLPYHEVGMYKTQRLYEAYFDI